MVGALGLATPGAAVGIGVGIGLGFGAGRLAWNWRSSLSQRRVERLAADLSEAARLPAST